MGQSFRKKTSSSPASPLGRSSKVPLVTSPASHYRASGGGRTVTINILWPSRRLIIRWISKVRADHVMATVLLVSALLVFPGHGASHSDTYPCPVFQYHGQDTDAPCNPAFIVFAFSTCGVYPLFIHLCSVRWFQVELQPTGSGYSPCPHG